MVSSKIKKKNKKRKKFKKEGVLGETTGFP
jgi:hypothetical protein